VVAFACALAAGIAAPVAAQDSTAVRALPPVQLHGFLQVYYRTGDPTTKDGYRLRKADLKFGGDVSPRLRWRVGFDAAKLLTVSKTTSQIADSTTISDVSIDQRTRILQDAALTYSVNHSTSIDIGQQILPLSLEGTVSTANVETIERTMFIIERSRAIGLGDIRDIGVSGNGLLGSVLEYHVGLFNETGEGAGTTDPNDQKAFIGRVALHAPGLTQLQVGGSGGFQGGQLLSRRERAGGEIQYRDSRVTFRAETMTARDGNLRRFGWYGLGAVRPTPQLQFVARFDSWDRDRAHESSIADAYERQIVFGGSYLLEGSVAKIAVNIVRATFPNVQTVPSGTFMLVAFQGVW
jgi:hypothetical protein